MFAVLRKRKWWVRICIPVVAVFQLLPAVSNAMPADAPATTSPEEILKFLNQTVIWYRLLASQQQLVTEPSDSVFLNDNRQIADQVVQLSFEFARTQAQQITSQSRDNAAALKNQPNSAQYQNLLNLAEQSRQRIDAQQKRLDSLKQQLAAARGKKRAVVQSAIAESEDEMELLKARSDTLKNILQFAVGMSTMSGPKGLQAQIDELARTVPAAATESKQPGGSSQSNASSQALGERTQASGLFGLIAEVFEFRRKLQLLDHSLALTDSLSDSSKALRSPAVARIKELTQLSDQLANQSPSEDPSVLAQQQAQLKDLTQQYKQLSAAILPLGKQNLLFDLYKRNVSNWMNQVQGRYSDLLKRLLVRLGSLVGIVAIILGASLIWRRATFRYVQDTRRRHQFLIVRRIIVIPLLLVIIVVTFANGLGSVTLFAGLSTAGLAVALQNLIQSVVGYFVLIGKYGVRVGDHIQVAGVTGDVMDIGLLRMHMVEASGGAQSRPTGRVVAFPNSVVFQPNAAFFKQIPGTSFLWHEVSLTVGPESDFRQVEQQMLQAVNRVFDDYKEKMESQHRSLEHAIEGLSARPLQPESRLQLTPEGTQVIVRYPLEMGDSEGIDDRIAREVLDATGREPRVHSEAEPSAAPAASTANEVD